MLKGKISSDKADNYLVSFNDVRNTIKDETREDYSQGVYEKMTPGVALFSLPNPKLAVQRLLKAGFITQTRKDITIPNVSGDYHVHLIWPKGSWTGDATYELHVSMQPSYASISGTYKVQTTYPNGGPAMSSSGPLSGSVSPDGTVHILYGGTPATYQYHSGGGTVTLTGDQPFATQMPTMTLTGTGAGGTISVPSYSYAFSTKFTPLPPPHDGEISAGTVSIDDVTNLLLAGETAARSSFAWHVDFDDAAKALTGQTKATGTGHAEFGKQPSGDWVLAGYGF
jgi:hypothetical protein